MAHEGAKPVQMLIKNSSNQWVPFDGSITTGDIEIGAVEIKDHDGTDRAEVTSDKALKVDQHTPTDLNGAPVTVGTSAVEMTFTGTPRSISIQADQDNSGDIWIGKSNIDNTGANAFGRLGPGRTVTIEFNDTTNAIYAVSDVASQKVYKMALT